MTAAPTKGRVLVVEDEGMVVTAFRRGLEKRSYEVAITATGADAVALAESFAPDAIVMDINLAGAMDGITAAMRIRELRITAPIIFLTGYADAMERASAAQIESITCLSKPCRLGTVVDAIELAVRRAAGAPGTGVM